MSESMEQQSPNLLSLPFVEALYADYLRDPMSVPSVWQRYFAGLGESNGFASRPQLSPSFPRRRLFGTPAAADAITAAGEPPATAVPGASAMPSAEALVRSYRARGHLIAKINPLASPHAMEAELDPAYFGFTGADLDRPVSGIPAAFGPSTLRQVLDRLRRTYCGSVGAQFLHIDELEIREWLQDRMEVSENRANLTREEQLRVLRKLTEAEVFESFIQKKYIGSKSFSVEGSESLIALLDVAIEFGASQGLGEIVLGMAHRGRLNVLANIMGKPPRRIFREFEDADPELYLARGDVKYHLGYSADIRTSAGHPLHLSLCYNPSHLEFVNPVALGRMRAKQDRVGDSSGDKGMVLLIHGDAAFAGEGVVQEILNMSQLPGYRTGGTIHVIVNNQIGFTTLPEEGRSTPYATDVAKMLSAPIFHVNGEDPEAVAYVIRLALEFRRRFHHDAVIDLYGYRRHGHNEGDEPAFTQPQLYREIAGRKPVDALYRESLIERGLLTREEADSMSRAVRDFLEGEISHARNGDHAPLVDPLTGIWKSYRGGPDAAVPEADTGVDAKRLSDLLHAQTRLPEGFTPHPKIKRGLEQRAQMARGEKPLDWSTAEAAAFANLTVEGHRIRLSGQDSARGTFSQRHSALHDVKNGRIHVPLQHLDPAQAPVEILNSPLTEAGVLGFEYGYSTEWPKGLILWEAQFGDFGNAAQVIIDQFLASGEEKWRRLSGLVLLLPHGFEGMGSEHSSARLERFLQLAARDNIQIVYPSTPAQYFHCLRRQALRPLRKPLVVMTPKSLLRHPAAVSPLSELTRGRFERVLPDPSVPPAGAKKVLLCSGKIYYELIEKRETLGRRDTAILRIEQLYPLAEETLRSLLSPYAAETPVVWVQEEPENMGAWWYVRARFGVRLFGRHPLQVASRPESATPASGAHSAHKIEQERLLSAAFGVA